jgi:hypothetical protein
MKGVQTLPEEVADEVARARQARAQAAQAQTTADAAMRRAVAAYWTAG